MTDIWKHGYIMSRYRYYLYPHTWPPGPRSIPARSRRTRTWCRAGWETPGSPRQACRGWSPLHEICTRFAQPRNIANILTQPLQGVQRGLLLPLRAGQLGPGRRGQQVGQHQRG